MLSEGRETSTDEGEAMQYSLAIARTLVMAFESDYAFSTYVVFISPFVEACFLNHRGHIDA